MIHDYQTPDRGWCGDRTRGAGMGRTSGLPENFAGPLQLRHVPLDSGGYDPGGAYWGSPDNRMQAMISGSRATVTARVSGIAGSARQAPEHKRVMAELAKLVEGT